MIEDIAFIDTETTGLNANTRELWEIALIIDDDEWLFYPTVSDFRSADPISLKIGRWYERSPHRFKHVYVSGATTKTTFAMKNGVQEKSIIDNREIAQAIAELTWDKHLVGAVPSFDEESLRDFLQQHNLPYGWHYHLMDIESIMIGFLAGMQSFGPFLERGLPIKYKDLLEALGLSIDESTHHTAMGDARLVKETWKKLIENY